MTPTAKLERETRKLKVFAAKQAAALRRKIKPGVRYMISVMAPGGFKCKTRAVSPRACCSSVASPSFVCSWETFITTTLIWYSISGSDPTKARVKITPVHDGDKHCELDFGTQLKRIIPALA